MMLKADADALPSTSLVYFQRPFSAVTCLHGKRIIIACHVEIYTIYGLFVCSQMESNGMGSVGLWTLQSLVLGLEMGWNGVGMYEMLALGT